MSFHCMIDLETLDKRATAKILSIGAVVFDATGQLATSFYSCVSLDGQESRTISDSTFRWWMRQSDKAREDHTHDTEVLSLQEALIRLSEMLEQYPGCLIWGNGAAFDNAILEHAYGELRRDPPWPHWDNRCFRTVKAQNMHLGLEPERQGVAHNALDDAIHQATHLCAIQAHYVHRGMQGPLGDQP